jgi:Putative adhesin
MKPAFAFFALVMFAGVGYGQMRDNRDTQLSCNNNNNQRDGVRNCEVRESTLGPSASLDIQPGHNGGIIVRGWSQNSVQVRALVEAWGTSDSDARSVASQVRVDTGGGTIQATGPDTNSSVTGNRNEGWAVSFEVFAPWNTDLKLESHNGGITVSDIRGKISFQSHNGGINLTRIAGEVSGETHNGGIQAELQGNTWEGRQLELSTYNGGITLSMPKNYSASMEAHATNGRLSSDFPVTVTGHLDARNMNFNLGAGGPSIKITTHNGGIKLKSM